MVYFPAGYREHHRGGYIFKFLSAQLLFGGFLAAIHNMHLVGWGIIIGSFLADALETGCLKSSFRPAYNALALMLYRSTADYVSSIRHYLLWRVGIPFLLLVIASGALHVIDLDFTSLLVLSLMAGARFAQILFTWFDLRVLQTASRPATPSVRLTLSYLRYIYKIDLLFFIIGNLLESFILLYMVGMFYRYNHFIAFSTSLNWMGSSLVSLGMYLFCAFISSAFIPLVAGKENSLTVNCLLFIPLLICLAMALTLAESSFGYYLGIQATTVCLVFATLFIRVASTRILQNGNDIYAASSFIYAEFFTSLMLAFCMASSFVISNDFWVRYTLMAIIVLSSGVYIALFMHNKRRLLAENVSG